jgi:hypothetical protein
MCPKVLVKEFDVHFPQERCSKVHRFRDGPGRTGPGRAAPRQGAAPGAEERCANAFKSAQIPARAALSPGHSARGLLAEPAHRTARCGGQGPTARRAAAGAARRSGQGPQGPWTCSPRRAGACLRRRRRRRGGRRRSQGGARPARDRGGEDRMACVDAAERAGASLLAPAAATETSWWAETQPWRRSGGGGAGPACGGGEDGLDGGDAPGRPRPYTSILLNC